MPHLFSPPLQGAGVCGPWVGADGRLSTHTAAQAGKIGVEFFSQNVQVDFEGQNFIIAHMKMGNIQITIGKPITVTGKVCQSHMQDCRNGYMREGGRKEGSWATKLTVWVEILMIKFSFYWGLGYQNFED
jgi:hypothetical protein